MNFEHEQWLKLYKRVDAAWLSMSVSARGLGDELLKYADESGRIFVGTEPPAEAFSRMLGARKREHARIAGDVLELVSGDRPFLVVDGHYVVIRNFTKAQQRGGSAARMAAKRSRDKSHRPSHVTSLGDADVPSPVTSQSDGSDLIRSDPPVVPQDPPTLRRRYNDALTAATGAPGFVRDTEDELGALDTLWEFYGAKKGLSVDAWGQFVTEQVKRFVDATKGTPREAFLRGWSPTKLVEWLAANPPKDSVPGEAKGWRPKPKEIAAPPANLGSDP